MCNGPWVCLCFSGTDSRHFLWLCQRGTVNNLYWLLSVSHLTCPYKPFVNSFIDAIKNKLNNQSTKVQLFRFKWGFIYCHCTIEIVPRFNVTFDKCISFQRIYCSLFTKVTTKKTKTKQNSNESHKNTLFEYLKHQIIIGEFF